MVALTVVGGRLLALYTTGPIMVPSAGSGRLVESAPPLSSATGTPAAPGPTPRRPPGSSPGHRFAAWHVDFSQATVRRVSGFPGEGGLPWRRFGLLVLFVRAAAMVSVGREEYLKIEQNS